MFQGPCFLQTLNNEHIARLCKCNCVCVCFNSRVKMDQSYKNPFFMSTCVEKQALVTSDSLHKTRTMCSCGLLKFLASETPDKQLGLGPKHEE